METRRRIAIVFATVFLLGAMILKPVQAAGRKSPEPKSDLQSTETPGFQKAPGFSLLNLAGEEVRLSDYDGKVVLLDFWATWCPPCIEEIPHFIELYNEYRERGFVILGVSVGEPRQPVEKFAKRFSMNYPVLFADQAILEAYPGIYFLPTAFLIDRSGFVRERLIGYQDKRRLEQKILLLLEDP